MKLKQQVIKHYNQVYCQRQSHPESLLSQWSRERELVKILSLIKPKDAILDLGCGDGTVALMMAKKAKRVIGVDISKQAIKQAKENQKKVKANNCFFIQADIDSLKYKNGSADFILCLGIFEYFTDLDKPLKKIIKFLKPGGKLYFHVWNQESLAFRLKKAFGFLDRNKPFKRSFYKLNRVKKMLTQNRLILIDSYGQLIANKFRIKNKIMFEVLENLGRNKFLARFLADNLVFVIKKPEALGLI